MALKHVEKCLSAFPEEEQKEAFRILCVYEQDLRSEGVSKERALELFRLLDNIRDGFRRILVIYELKDGDERLDSFVSDFCKPERMLTPPQPCPDRPDGWVPLAELPAPE
jgi:hypothetical protein